MIYFFSLRRRLQNAKILNLFYKIFVLAQAKSLVHKNHASGFHQIQLGVLKNRLLVFFIFLLLKSVLKSCPTRTDTFNVSGKILSILDQISETFNVSGKILSILDQIRRDLAVIRRNLGQTSTDPAKFRLDLAESSQKLFLAMKPDTQTDTTRNQRDPNRKIRPDHSGWFQVIFSSTLIIRVGFGSGTNPTRPDLWTPLVDTKFHPL